MREASCGVQTDGSPEARNGHTLGRGNDPFSSAHRVERRAASYIFGCPNWLPKTWQGELISGDRFWPPTTSWPSRRSCPPAHRKSSEYGSRARTMLGGRWCSWVSSCSVQRWCVARADLCLHPSSLAGLWTLSGLCVNLLTSTAALPMGAAAPRPPCEVPNLRRYLGSRSTRARFHD